jgi:polysaccharide chain length determinant protein (PEP-CTERM system associated)
VAEQQARKVSPVDLVLGICKRRWWLALVVFAAPFTAVLGLVTFAPDVYEATAKVVVERQQVPEAFVKTTVTSELESRLRAISEEVLSRTRLQELITRYNLYPNLRQTVPPETLVERMRANILPLTLSSEGKGPRSVTVSFTIGFRGGDPQTVALVTNALAAFYIEENLKVRERMATGTAQFLRVQLEETKKRLDEQERRVSDFKRKHIGELPNQMSANLTLLERLGTQLALNSTNMARALERREVLLKEIAEADALGPNAAPDAIAPRLVKLREQLTEARTRFTDKHPDIRRLREEIALLENQLSQEKAPEVEATKLANPTLSRLRQSLAEKDAEIRALRAEEKNIRTAMADYQRRVDNSPRREQEFQELDRDYETTKDLYRSLLKRYDEAQLAENMEQSQKGEQFRVVDRALPPTAPAAPKRLKLILMGLVAALGLGVGAAVLAEQLDGSFHAVDDLRDFSPVPVLLTLPRIVTATDVARSQIRARLATGVAVVGLAVIFGAAFVVAKTNAQLLMLLAR